MAYHTFMYVWQSQSINHSQRVTAMHVCHSHSQSVNQSLSLTLSYLLTQRFSFLSTTKKTTFCVQICRENRHFFAKFTLACNMIYFSRDATFTRFKSGDTTEANRTISLWLHLSYFASHTASFHNDARLAKHGYSSTVHCKQRTPPPTTPM